MENQSTIGATKISSCTCKHEYQDKVYGKRKRVFNILADKSKGCRCTVCGVVKM